MNRSLIIRLCVIGLIILLAVWLASQFHKLEIGTMFAIVVLGGCVLGILAAKFILPWIGDAVGTFFYSSGELAVPDDSLKAAAKLAQGDYEGAIAEYEKILSEKPDDTLAISEIAKIRAEKMDDPRGAIAFLESKIQGQEWKEDDAAFLMFRLADLHLEVLNDPDTAGSVLEQVVAQFPNTRHSANAHHKINEVRQAQFKSMNQQRS